MSVVAGTKVALWCLEILDGTARTPVPQARVWAHQVEGKLRAFSWRCLSLT